MDTIDILMPVPVMDSVARTLGAAFSLHRAYEADDREAAVAAVAGRVRGLAVDAAIRVDAAYIDRFPRLEIIGFYGVGYDPVDAVHAASRGIMVTNTPDVLTEEVADTAMGLVVMTARELSAAERHLRAGRWARDGAYPLTVGTLRGKTMGILGLGRIGKAIARRAEAFGLAIVYHGRNSQPDQRYRYFADLAEMARAVDILVAVAPGGTETRHMVDSRILEALGPEGILINIGRGSVVDEQALVHALEKGVIHAAGLDVFESEPDVPAGLVANDRAVLLPHVASASVHTRTAMGKLLTDNLETWFGDGRALTPVPECAGITRKR